MDLQFTAVFRCGPEEYSGFVEELSGAARQLARSCHAGFAANREPAEETLTRSADRVES
jgi:hypothetical protein